MTRPNVQTTDRLPPHSPEAETAILGCVLVDPATSNEVMAAIGERFAGAQPFYDLRHATVYAAMQALRLEDRTIDVIGLQQRLKDEGNLEAVGGRAWLSELPGLCVPALLAQYLDSVWTRYLARTGVRSAADWAAQLYRAGEMTEQLLLDIRQRVEAMEWEASRHQATPKLLKRPSEFAEDFHGRFFGGLAGSEPGLELPVDFKFKIRMDENTLVTGDDGSGKSTVLAYFALHLAAAGQKVAIASFEMPPAVSLWILGSQLLGAKRQADCTAGHGAVRDALLWLMPRFYLYDFLGIGDWRDVLDTFRYAAEKLGVTVFILDSVMRIGIADDDYATQAIVAVRFAQFAKKHHVHLFFVIHENAGDKRGKERIRGSKLWRANTDNIVRVERNAAKMEKIGRAQFELETERKAAARDEKEIASLEKKISEAERDWDTHLHLQKQRWPGSRQNASRFVFFDPENFQLRAEQNATAVNWLARWGKKEAKS